MYIFAMGLLSSTCTIAHLDTDRTVMMWTQVPNRKSDAALSSCAGVRRPTMRLNVEDGAEGFNEG